MSKDHGRIPNLGTGDIIDSRLFADGLARVNETTLSASEVLSATIALGGAEAFAQERQRRQANGVLIGEFVCALPAYTQRGIIVDDIEMAKRVQSSVIWPLFDEPAYITGSKLSKNPKYTELLATAVTNAEGGTSYRCFTGSVYTEDFRQWQEVASTLLQQEYTHEQVQALMDTDIGQFVVKKSHPRSIRLRDSFLAEPDGPVDRVFKALIHQARPNFMLPANVARSGIRMRKAFDKSYQQINPSAITDADMEIFGVFNSLSDLADRFGSENTLRLLYENWLNEHGGDLVL